MGWIEDFLEYTSEVESPTSFLEASAMSVIAAAAERKIWFNRGVGNLFANMFIVLVGPPASRKTSAMNYAMRLLEQVEKINIAPDGVTREQMFVELDEGRKYFELNGKRIAHSSYQIAASELSFFLGEKDTKFLTSMIKMFDCEDRFKYHTKHQGRYDIDNVYVNLIGAIQPELVPQTLPISAIGSGFTSRLIYVVEEDRRCEAPDPKLHKEYEEGLVEGLRQINKCIGEFRFDAESGEFYNDWYRTQQDKSPLNADVKFKSYVHRKPQHLLKVALVKSLSRSLGEERIVRLEDVLGALDWLNSLERRMPEVYRSFGQSEYAGATDAVRAFVKDRGEVEMSDLAGAFFRDLSEGDLWKVINTLKLMKVLRVEGDKIIFTGGKHGI